MDPLLRELEESKLGPSILSIYAGTYAHADDICTVTSSLSSLNQQVPVCMVQSQVWSFDHLFHQTSLAITCLHPRWPTTLSTGLCEMPWILVVMGPQPPKELMGPSGKLEEPFFSYGGLEAFQGKLNPISSKTIYETCAVPILLYGCENWILTNSQLDFLVAFQGEIQRILKLSRFHSILSARIALKWPSISTRTLIRKFSLLF